MLAFLHANNHIIAQPANAYLVMQTAYPAKVELICVLHVILLKLFKIMFV